ncbi:uncharacterized protein [Procambarus clarkii]|uniref:uncharacterized protein n=1 Tax=Procambarus clarkii TaxID=6728 RepID=UPI003744104B
MGSSRPPVQRTLSAGLAFTVPVDHPLVGVALVDVLHVQLSDLVGVQLLQGNRAVVKFRLQAAFQVFLERCEGRVYPLPDSAGSVKVVNLSVTLTSVAVHGAPFEFQDDFLTSCFERFGTVLSVRWNKVVAGHCVGMLDGSRTLTMSLKCSVPSSMSVLGYTLRCLYRGQPRTCYRCGHEGHLAAACDVGAPGRVHVFRAEDFPPLLRSDGSEDGVGAVPEAPDCLSAAPPVEASSTACATRQVTAVAPGVVEPVCVGVEPSPELRVVQDVSVEVHVPPPPVDVLPAPGDAGSAVLEGVLRQGEVPAVSVCVGDCSSALSVPLQKRARRCSEAVSLDDVDSVGDVASVDSSDGAGVACVDVKMVAVPAAGPAGRGVVRPVSKRSRRARSVSPLRGVPWEEVGEYGYLAPPAENDGAVRGSEVATCASPPASPAVGSPQWGVVPDDRDLVVMLRKDVRQRASAPVPGGGVGAAPASPAVSPPSLLQSGDCLVPSAGVVPCEGPELGPYRDARVLPIPWCSSTVWVSRVKEFVYRVPDRMSQPRAPPGGRLPADLRVIWEAYCLRFPIHKFPEKY